MQHFYLGFDKYIAYIAPIELLAEGGGSKSQGAHLMNAGHILKTTTTTLSVHSWSIGHWYHQSPKLFWPCMDMSQFNKRF